ncbi:MAG TPA: hypothetical protein VFU71_09515 [Burkholderiaceae bacterium]|nr:hypothetical protein [Burkholderiaceae bacterium]
MSFLDSIVGVAKSVVETVAPVALSAIFPPAAMLGPLSNLATSMLGSALGGAIGELGQQCGMPNFVMKQAQSLLQDIVSKLLKPVDPQCMDHVADKAGRAIGDLVSNMISDFKDAFQNYLNDSNKKGEGKGGTGKAAGGGAVGFRELAQILAELEQKQAKNVQDASKKAADALGIDKSDKGAEQKQFEAMEGLKAEAQIFQALSSAISEVMKNFGGALNTAARGG